MSASDLTESSLAEHELSSPGPRGLASLAVIIPAWKPGPGLIALVAELAPSGFGKILVVDDGNSTCHSPCDVIDRLNAIDRVKILHHAVNLGKGRGLKTAFNHVLTSQGNIAGVVTADADGQHTPEDILRVAEALLLSGARPVLGVRRFGPDVPLRSRVGNLLTRRVFTFLTGSRISDTQTGLRGLPLHVLPSLLALEGERYEYEMTVLAHLCRSGPAPVQVPIATVYIENNRGSHFDPIWDSMRIYFVLLRFYTSSLFAAGLDLAGFSLCFAVTHHVLLSVVVGRLSSLVNFAVNRRFVFHSHASVSTSLWRYYLLAAVIAAVSYGLIVTLHTYAHWNVFAAKILVDVLLSLMSFSAQRTFVFRRGEPI